jgi:hypothetical protein
LSIPKSEVWWSVCRVEYRGLSAQLDKLKEKISLIYPGELSNPTFKVYGKAMTGSGPKKGFR